MLKKWSFDFDEYDGEEIIVFAENLEEALEIVNKSKWGSATRLYDELDDFDIEELEILQPEKAYKGCYREVY